MIKLPRKGTYIEHTFLRGKLARFPRDCRIILHRARDTRSSKRPPQKTNDLGRGGETKNSLLRPVLAAPAVSAAPVLLKVWVLLHHHHALQNVRHGEEFVGGEFRALAVLQQDRGHVRLETWGKNSIRLLPSPLRAEDRRQQWVEEVDSASDRSPPLMRKRRGIGRNLPLMRKRRGIGRGAFWQLCLEIEMLMLIWDPVLSTTTGFKITSSSQMGPLMTIWAWAWTAAVGALWCRRAGIPTRPYIDDFMSGHNAVILNPSYQHKSPPHTILEVKDLKNSLLYRFKRNSAGGRNFLDNSLPN